jgi:CRP-like cAMP-binding protein
MTGANTLSGKNIVLKPGQILFKAGDTSDGMYLIRKGELRVYLDQGNKEVALATVNDGGMIGEMALFDKKPRSASVKAVSDCEITLISNEDFAKLMKQIPKWFVSLMGTLSGRLRATNERLQKMEGGIKGKPFQTTLRMLHVLSLLWHKDGVKEGKAYQIDKKATTDAIRSMFNEDADRLEEMFKVMVTNELIEITKNSYNAVVLSMANRAILTSFIEYMGAYVQANQGQPYLPEAGLEILQALDANADKSAYETYSIALDELMIEGRKADLQLVDKWKDMLPYFKLIGEEVKLVKTGSGGLGFRTSKKDIKKIFSFHKLIAALHKANLS